MTTSLDELVQRWAASVASVTGPSSLSLRGVGIDVVHVRDADAELRSRWTGTTPTEPAEREALARAVQLSRAGLLSCTPAGDAIDIAVPLFLDGLTRNEFLHAVGEVAKAHESLAAAADAWSDQRQAAEEAAKKLAEIDAALFESDQIGAHLDAFGEPVGEAAAVAGGAPGTQAWFRTHVVPMGGVAAWAQPDPASPPETTLAPGVELQLLDVQNGWAYVAGSNDWRGWVDASLLAPAQ